MFFVRPHQVVVHRPEKSLSFRQTRELAEIVVAAGPVPASSFLVQAAYNGILGHTLPSQNKRILPVFINKRVLHLGFLPVIG